MNERARRELLPVHINSVCINELATPLKILDIVARKYLHVHAIQAIKLFSLVILESLPCDGGTLCIPSTRSKESAGMRYDNSEARL